MERKHFVTISQKVLTKIITISVTKNSVRYDYMICKLPSTFKGRVAELWNKRTNKGKKVLVKSLGGSGLVRFENEDKEIFKVGDVLTATFKDNDVSL